MGVPHFNPTNGTARHRANHSACYRWSASIGCPFIDEEDLAQPWQRSTPSAKKLSGASMPKSLTVTLANFIYFEKAQLPQALANRLIRLAAFQNPEFYKAQAMRLSVWDKPRVIGCAENYPQHIALPRGCLDAARELLRDNGIHCDLRDERYGGEPLEVTFVGKLRPDQQLAVAAMLSDDVGVLCAPTAFGKTVVAAAMIANRGVNTLVLVHRMELLNQWQERLRAFLCLDKSAIGTIGGGKARPGQAKREYLRTLAADFDQCWQAADKLAERGIASAYDEVVRALVDLSEAYALCAARADFDRKLVQFMARHGKRGALVRRLADAGLRKQPSR